MAAITKEYLESEIVDLQSAMEKYRAAYIKCEGTVEAYQMLISKLEQPEPEYAESVQETA